MYKPSAGAQGHQKWGKSHDVPTRYTKPKLGDNQVQELVRGKAVDIHDLERFLAERFKGPLNREKWAGTVKVKGSVKDELGMERGIQFSRDKDGNGWAGPVEMGHLPGPTRYTPPPKPQPARSGRRR
jgi:hypothetical protein